MRWLHGHQVDSDARQLGGLVVLSVLLYAAAGVGMAYVAGFGAVHRHLDHARWWWLAPAFGGVVLAFAGYYAAYRGIEGADDGPRLDARSLLAVVAAGFGGFLAQGGGALDEVAMRAAGADEREAKVRVGALAGFEHGVLAMIVCPASIAALAAGVVIPRTDFTWPWAVIPPVGFAAAIWAAERYRTRLRGRDGWRGKLVMFYDAAHIVWLNLRHPGHNRFAILGMALYWGADMFALWAATSAFGFHMTVLAVIVALGTGMIVTRRTAPLGGAGLMLVALVPTLWYGAAVPFAAATLGVAAYRLFTLFVPMPAGFAALPQLRALSEHGEDSPTGGGTAADRGEPALQH